MLQIIFERGYLIYGKESGEDSSISRNKQYETHQLDEVTISKYSKFQIRMKEKLNLKNI